MLPNPRNRKATALLLAALLLGPWWTVATAAAPRLVVHHGDAGVRAAWVQELAAAGLTADAMDDAGLQALDPDTTDLLLIAPGSRFPPKARPALHRFTNRGGSVFLLSPRAFASTPRTAEAVRLADFAGEAGWSVLKPASPYPWGRNEVRLERLVLPDGSPGISLWTARLGDGLAAIEIPLSAHRGSARALLRLRVRGDFGVDILRLGITDNAGRQWVGFAQLGREWTVVEVPLADFLPLDDAQRLDGAGLDPATIETLTLGMDAKILWPELGGSFGIALAELVGLTEPLAPTSELLRWRTAAQGVKAAVPDWITDPFLDAKALPAEARIAADAGVPYALTAEGLTTDQGHWVVPPPPVLLGRSDTDVNVFVPAHETRRIPLVVARDPAGGTARPVVELRLPIHRTANRRHAMLLSGLAESAVQPGSELGRQVLNLARQMLEQPRLLAVYPNTSPAGSGSVTLQVRVRLFNPAASAVPGRLSVTVDGLEPWRGEVHLPAREETAVPVDLGEVPESFPLPAFQWRVELGDGGQTWDAMGDAVDLERSLLQAAGLLVANQRNHADGRISHHYFADVYGARALLQAGRLFAEPPRAARHADLLAACPPSAMTETALRFADMIVRRQRPDGAFPMGYHEDKGYAFTADGASIALGLIQMASWIEDGDRAKAYLDAARRFQAMRQTFRLDEATAGRLREAYGADAKDIVPGNYGLGYLGSDFYSKERWEAVRPERRGPHWVFTISMVTAPALALVTGDALLADIARQDASHFLASGYRAESHFHSESTAWLYALLRESDLGPPLRERLLQDAVPAAMSGLEHDPMGHDGRRILRWLALNYCRRWFGDSAAIRAALVKALWELGSESSPYSLHQVAASLPGSGNLTAVGASHYAAFAAIVLTEMRLPGATLVRPPTVDPIPVHSHLHGWEH